MKTVSTSLPSASRSSHLRVPSAETCAVTISGRPMRYALVGAEALLAQRFHFPHQPGACQADQVLARLRRRGHAPAGHEIVEFRRGIGHAGDIGPRPPSGKGIRIRPGLPVWTGHGRIAPAR
jgi:hypothetical protein